MSHKRQRAEFVKNKARELGFTRVGIARAERLDQDADQLRNWLDDGKHGTMRWMENWFEKRVDPRKLVPGAKSVIVLTHNYFSEKNQSDRRAPRIARYARGKDYHWVLKQKLWQLLDLLKQEVGDFSGRAFVDSAPVLERAWAARAGVGWIGKNSLLLHPDDGSFFFLSELIVDIELEYDEPIADQCGSCTMCMTSCPTQAIVEPRIVDARRCISYLTIEHRGELPDIFKSHMENWMFGCDICQDVCPYNRKATPHDEALLEPDEKMLQMTWEDWQNLDRTTFNRLFKGTAVTRTRYQGLKRNIEFLGSRPPKVESDEDIEARRARAREILSRRPRRNRE
jgi:epoxyqueuosine reductase